MISAAKGIEDGTLFTMTDILEQVLPQAETAAVLSGPSHAEEVARLLADGVCDRCAYGRDSTFSAEAVYGARCFVCTSARTCSALSLAAP